MTPFDYLNSISESKDYLITDSISEKGYNPFLTNRGLSYFPDTLFYAQQANMMSHLSKKDQYDYLFHSVSSRKRRSKWHKPEENEVVDAIAFVFECSHKKADQYANVMAEDKKKEILKIYKSILQ